MTLRRLRTLWKSLPILAAMVFAVQAVVHLPQHAFHGITHATRSGTPAHHQEAPCDFCLAYCGLDSATAVAPPVEGLSEAAFALVAAYPSFEYSHPEFFAQARGPPAV